MQTIIQKDRFLNYIENTNHPFKNLQIQALERFNKISLPPSYHESWRKINLNLIPFNSLKLVDAELQTNITTQYTITDPSIIEKFLMLNIDSSKAESYHFEVDYFTLLNVALLQNIHLIQVPSNTKEQIKITHKAISGDGFFPFVVIIAKEGSEVEILQQIEGIEEQALWNSTVYILAEKNSRVKFVSVRNHTDYEFHFHKIRVIQHKDSYVHTAIFHTGGITGKGFLQARLLEENIEFRGIGFFFGEKGHFHNMEMDVQHRNNYETSSLLYKTIVKDRAHSVFIGKLETPHKIKGVNSHQLNHNLILSKKAKAESMPWLIVRSEDVSCEHGATAGDLDEEAIFYLQTRGLTEKEAKRLLMMGFIYDLIQETHLSEEEKDAYIENLSNKL
jgi:Fe-S cluster assembly scaffold protein SufB